MEPLVIIAVVFGLYMAWNIGANDVANSMADAVGSRALTVFWAVVLAGIFEFAGAFLVGSHVTDTVRKGIVPPEVFINDPHVLAIGLVCALLAAAVWLNIASYYGLPVSTTHSIVGGVAGFGVLAAGVSQVAWGTLLQIVASWFISPIVGGIVAYVLFKWISRFILGVERPIRAAIIGVPVCVFLALFVVSIGTIFKGLKNLNLDLNATQSFLVSGALGAAGAMIVYALLRKRWADQQALPVEEQLDRVEKVFGILVIITSCSVAFSHGANDVANAVGPLAGVIEIVNTNQVPQKVGVELWVLALGGFGIVLGLATYGYRVMQTVGYKITEITPSRGVAADLGATITVLSCTRLGLPISTTHTLVGAIIGVGMARGIAAIDRRVITSIGLSWLITVPIVAVITMVFFVVAHHGFGW